MTAVAYIILIARLLVFAVFVYALVLFATAWAVRRGYLKPFGFWPRLVRRMSGPVIGAVERRILRAGGNPQQAPLWFLVGVVVGGLVLLALVEWVIGTAFTLRYVAGQGPRGLLYFAVQSVFSILMIALFVRVIASWFGISPYSRWMRVVMALTDWIVEPLRRVVPPIGMIDITPMIAYLLLLLARSALLGLIAGAG